MEDEHEVGKDQAEYFDLNYTSVDCLDEAPLVSCENVNGPASLACKKVCKKRKRSHDNLSNARIYKDLGSSRGGIVKASGVVLRVRSESLVRRPNVICRVETFGKIVGSFDQRRRNWVIQMGFGGLLHLVDMHLRRALYYWLMTRIDPVNEMLYVDGKQFRMSSVHVLWVLGLLKGPKPIPLVCNSEVACRMVNDLEGKYGQVWTSVEGGSGKVVRRKGFAITVAIVERLMSNYVVEFKTLLLMAALDMVLCPTQCSCFPKDLVPALTCAIQAREYNWRSLVLEKLISVKRFGRRFYSEGFAGGCGGCTLFVAVWNDKEIWKACLNDRSSVEGDFGISEVLDVAYEEKHPREPRDVDFSSDDECTDRG